MEYWLFWKYKILTEINLRQGTVFYKVGGVRKNVDIRKKEQSDSIRKVTFLTCLSAHSRVDYLIPFPALERLVVQSR